MAEQPSIKLEAIVSLLAAITRSAADPYELAEVIFLEIARMTEPDVFELGIFEENSYRTLIRVVDGTRQDNLKLHDIAAQPDLLEWIHRAGQSVLYADFDQEKESLPADTLLSAEQMPTSGLFVPLLFGERVLGVISLQSQRTNAFNSQDRDLVTIIAATIAPALTTTSLAGEIEFLTLQMLLIQQVSRLLMTLEPLSDRMTRIIALLAQVFEISEIAVYELIEEEIELRVRTTMNDETQSSSSIPELVSKAITTGETQSTLPVTEIDQTEANSSQSQFAFPLNIVHHRLGALHLCCPRGKEFDEEQLRVLETISQQLSFAILEARNYSKHQQEAWVTTVLLEVARHAAQPGDPLAALQAVLQLATLLVGTEWIVLMTYDVTTGLLHFATSAGLKRQQSFTLAEAAIELSETGIGPPYKENEQPIILDIPAPMNAILQDDKALCLVLSDGRDLLGLLLTENEQLTGKQPSLVAGIAHQISLRLENSRLIEKAAAQRSLERELAMARDIQLSFLPSSIPEVAGLEIGVAWRLAREVGGDFYDFIPLPTGPNGSRFGIVIADVADKGVPAALYMALSRTLLRTLSMELVDPGKCLEKVNRLLIQDTRADLFVSVFYAIWEPDSGLLNYANAGHNPPLLFTPRQRGELLTEHGMVLGVQDSSTYHTHQITIHPQQLLVLYTDGVTDALDENDEFFGIQRLESLVLGMPDWHAQQVAERIEERVVQFTGRRDLFDDLTAITICR